MGKYGKRVHTLLSAFALVLVSIFAVWWFNLEHIPNNFDGYADILDVSLFALVSFVIWHPIVMAVFSWSVLSNIKEHNSTKPEKGHKVAFVTTFVPSSESVELLHKCLPAMVKASYKHDTWLLDEGNDDEVKEICRLYGVKHFSRANEAMYNTEGGKFAKKTKGGNHNSWYDVHGHQYDFVAQIDTDFVPNKSFLTKTLGYFKDPKIAFVGTPQIYGNTGDSLIAKGAAEQTYSFYGPILRGFHGMEMNMLIGANHVIRVKALEDVDHYSAHITEDLLTGMKLHAKGWKSAYVSEVLAIGEGPATWKAYFAQQMRWAYGCMHILRHFSFKLFRSMSWRQKVYYFMLQQHYFSGLAMTLGGVGLGLYFGLGINTARVEFVPFLSLYLPVLAAVGLMALWMQRFHVRPKHEKGLLFAGKIISAASWPIFFLAFVGVVTGKRLTYKVTPKGKNKIINEDSISLFKPHIAIGIIALAGIISSIYTGRTSLVMMYWGVLTASTMLFVPVAQPVLNFTFKTIDYVMQKAKTINVHYRIFELRAAQKVLLPSSPSEEEKWAYVDRNFKLLMTFSLISFTMVTVSMSRFIAANPAIWILFSFLALTVFYYIVSFVVNVGTAHFNYENHIRLVASWMPRIYPSVDVFLPTAGENLAVLENTWEGVSGIVMNYQGKVNVYCLDDSGREEVEILAKRFGFKYASRPNRGQHKKAGNLRFGYSISKGAYIVIFDADFRPRHDFLDELLPHLENDHSLGIVQSPQYFDVHNGQNWLERGAGAVQELFYRFSQVSREHNGSAICVGSNAIYRRKALDQVGGTALIEHSEDVHTGFNLRMEGWGLKYVPVVLAKGLCPDSMPAFFKQQYRWCMGSMSLLGSEKFWKTPLKIRSRFSYFSGFLYYIHTAIMSLFTPVIPLYLLIIAPEALKTEYILFILPSFIFTWFVFPYWHNVTYGIESWSVRSVYGWAHLFAVYDSLTKNAMSWQPTGAVKGSDYRYLTFRVMQAIFNFIPAVIWVVASGWHVFFREESVFIFMFVSGLLYLAITLKVTFYTTKPFYLRKAEERDPVFVPKSAGVD
jgi:cellulose synthase (UDP-forming)